MNFDLIIIGGGPAGYTAAIAAGKHIKTLLIEKNKIGGTCLNEGCIPSKTLLYSAKIYEGIKNGQKYGVRAENISYDQQAVINRKNKVLKTLSIGIKSKLKSNNVQYMEGTAYIEGKEQNLFKVSVDNNIYYGTKILIATGSKVFIPPINGVYEALASGFAVTNKEVLEMSELPSKVSVIGGGIIGLEFASYFCSLGKDVTVIEQQNKIVGNLDDEISAFLMKSYEKKGVKFILNAKVTNISDNNVEYELNNSKNTINADKVILSVGRKANISDLGLENIGINLSKNCIPTDSTGITNVEGVYAAGDVNGVSMLAHTAYREAEACINNILGRQDTVNYTAIPSVIYTNPEVATVGETEATAAKKNIKTITTKLSLRNSGRFMAENEASDGICKLILDSDKKTVIGAHIAGSYASEIIYGACILIQQQIIIEDIKKIVFPHPTVSEIIKEGLYV